MLVAALIINALIIILVPKVFRKPTGIKPIDDIILYLNTQTSYILQSSIILAIVLYSAEYWLNASDTPSMSPAVKPFSAK
jgi:hypothetical protein